MHGLYYDPLHGGCLRAVRRASPDTYRIDGVYGDDEAPRTHKRWTAVASVLRRDADGALHLSVDFGGKPDKTPRVLTARYATRSLRWADGNVWKQLYAHAAQLR